MALLQGLAATATGLLGSKTLKSKNACSPRSQKLQVLISTLASFELFDVLPCSYSPDNGVSLGLISVSLHKKYFGVLSLKNIYNKYRTEGNWANYEKQRNFCVNLLCKTKTEYFQKLNVKD